MKPGDPVAISVDTYPGRVWQGTVESIAPPAASEFSVLPAQNSSGNWVKVVQRLPVRIRVDRKPGDPDLRAGMSVEADIDTGHERHLSPTWCRDRQTNAGTAGRRIAALITVCAMIATLMQALDFDHRQRRAALHAGQPVGHRTTRSPGC